MSEVQGLDTALHLQSNDFVLFGLEPGFALDRQALDARWKQLQSEAHPDRFVAQGSAAQRVAMQWSVRINEAYSRLKDPLKRGAYWCELQGNPVNAESNTAMPTEFLMQQMAWREALDDAHTHAALQALLDDTQSSRTHTLDTLASCIDTQHDAAGAVSTVRALMFIERFADEVQTRLDRLE